jgi:hypothetical protein
MPEQQIDSSDAWKQEAIQKSLQAYSRELALQKTRRVNEILAELSSPK